MSIEKTLTKSVILHGINILETCNADLNSIKNYSERISSENLPYPIPKSIYNKNIWYMPDTYRSLDIEKYLLDICPKSNLDRLNLELKEYKNQNLLDLLRQMKYVVDTLKKNNVLWGVGRGSSVSSYVLFLLGVHRIDSVKYNLPIEEFFKEIKNG